MFLCFLYSIRYKNNREFKCIFYFIFCLKKYCCSQENKLIFSIEQLIFILIQIYVYLENLSLNCEYMIFIKKSQLFIITNIHLSYEGNYLLLFKLKF